MTCGAVGGHSFMVIYDVLVSKMIDPNPINGGHVGFSAYCTMLGIKDIEVREICRGRLNRNTIRSFEPVSRACSISSCVHISIKIVYICDKIFIIYSKLLIAYILMP